MKTNQLRHMDAPDAIHRFCNVDKPQLQVRRSQIRL